MPVQQIETSGYRVFTRRFDQVVNSDELPTRSATEGAWDRFMDQTLERRTAWELDGLQLADTLRSQISEAELESTLITLLIDHSGSMRGERMLLTAAAVDVARAFLVHLGVSVEILGFTTSSWKGGWSRRLWRWTGRRRNPGRLCDLLHIIYATVGDRRPGSGMRSLVHMLDPGLLKENVDGEALLWAATRQDQFQHKQKAIVMVSDGAPVDDATLLANGPTFLTDHLREVVIRLQASRTMAQLQIGREAESPFQLARQVEVLSDLGDRLFDLLGDVLLAPNTARSASRA